MSSSISIFEIPLLLKLICENLDPEAIFACRRVCRTWDVLFSPYEWQSVKIVTATAYSCELPDDEDFIPLHQNARLVRRLILDNTRLFEPLLNPCTSWISLVSKTTEQRQDGTAPKSTETHDFVRLLSLTCDMVHRADGDQDWAFKDHPTLLPALIQQNLGLLHLHLSKLDTSNADYNEVLFKAIGQHPSLTCLLYAISPDNTEIPRAVIQQMLGWLPESLQTLRITTVEPPLLTEDVRTNEGTVAMHCRPTRLQTLDLNLEFRGCEETLLFPILQNCPQLTSFCLGDINDDMVQPLAKLLKEHCPKLVELNFYWDSLDHWAVSDLILQGTAKNQLRSLGLNGWSSMVENPFNEEFFDILHSVLDHCGPMLQALSIREGLRISHDHYSEILWKCPQLKELTLARPEDPFGRCYRAGLDCTTLQLLASRPWVCAQLEVLQLTAVIDYPKHPFDGEKSLESGRSQELATFIQHLGQLKCLREIHLGWMSFDNGPPPFFQAIEPFWDSLAQLSRLEKFLVRSYDMESGLPEEDQPFKKQDRIEWIKEHWPRLVEIQELHISDE
ncbi:hypothetical protein EMPS_11095 [Entomortierella parvispora]|uniref:F-box domain-containing protein n=1 Tax=Entomortierella parvispora TaxID=205924 RepID=A0A9P3HLA4_9FUNG|nr:hypothetical protein EMPS_11095 [Entomortierella parvispora]